MMYYGEVSMFCITVTQYTYSSKHIWSHCIASSNCNICIGYEKEKNKLHANLPCIYVPCYEDELVLEISQLLYLIRSMHR